MATSNIAVTEGSGKYVGTNSISEDAVTKQLQRVVPNKSDGTELVLPAALGQGTMAASLPVVIASNQSAVPVSGTLTAVTTVSTVTNLSQLAGAAVPIGAGTESTAVRVTLPTDGTGVVKLGAGTAFAGYVGDGKTHKWKTGSASATFTIVAAVSSKKIKVYSLSLITASTTAVTVTFKDGASGTALATYPLQAITGTNFGIAESLDVPSSLFETTATTLLEMAFSAAQTVTYNLRYWDDDAT